MTWTKSELLKALRDNRVAGVAAVGLTVQFLLKNDDRRGIVVQGDGSIKRFSSDSSAWRFVEVLNQEARKPVGGPKT